MPIVQKETKRVIREKEEYLREFYAQRVEKDIKIQQETQISKIIEGIFWIFICIDEANDVSKNLKNLNIYQK